MISKIAAALACVVAVGSAHGQSTISLPLKCIPIAKVDQVLKEYKEKPYFIGLDGLHGVDNLALSIHLNAETGTFTVIFIANQGSQVCVVSSGEKGKILYQQ